MSAVAPEVCSNPPARTQVSAARTTFLLHSVRAIGSCEMWLASPLSTNATSLSQLLYRGSSPVSCRPARHFPHQGWLLSRDDTAVGRPADAVSVRKSVRMKL